MNYHTNIVLSLSIVLLTIITKRWCNAQNEKLYSFRYSVDAPGIGIISQHWEERQADLVHGAYSFLEPTGKIRIVQYHVNGKHGFRAVVTIRDPPDFGKFGHLHYPNYYKGPIFFEKPVSFITKDLFMVKHMYPNLP